MSNENNEQIKKLQDDLAGNQSEEQMKDCQMKESVAQAGISNTASNPFTHIDEHNKAMNAYREKFGHDCDYNLTTKDIYALIYPNSTLIEETNSEFIPQPHEQRVIDEYAEIHDRANKLLDFINTNPIFKTLPKQVQFLRKAQLFHMLQYSGILNEIIYLFKGGKEMEETDGQQTIGDFGTDNEKVFDLKYISAMMIDATNHYGNDRRRNAIVKTDMEKVQMMAVKSVFSKVN